VASFVQTLTAPDPIQWRLSVLHFAFETALHAKVAIVDDTALFSSANLTDDVFSRNVQVGVMATNPELLRSITAYFEALTAEQTLRRLQFQSCDR
jgi:phosphatidylserine/phosphatidylglycerophosphate/cardiolipin synthase-like enzyme